MGGTGSGRTPARRQRCSKCKKPGHKANRCGKAEARAEKLSKPIDLVQTLAVGDRLLVVESFEELEPNGGGPWFEGEEFEIVEVLGEKVDGYELCALRTEREEGPFTSIALPQLYPFQRRPIGGSFEIPRVGMGMGIKSIPELIAYPPPEVEPEAPVVPDPPEMLEEAIQVPQKFQRRVRTYMAATGDTWETALRAVLAQERRPTEIPTGRCIVLERTGRRCISCRPADSRKVAVAG